MVVMLWWYSVIIFTFRLQYNSTAVTTFELYIDEEVEDDNKLYMWYKRSMERMVHGTKWSTRGTNSPWYE